MTITRPSSAPLRRTAKVLPADVRRHNRALVLQSLFREGGMSRADLARATALTRVTVSDLVADLVGEELVEEIGARPGGRVGKPGTLVGLRGDAILTVALDLSDDRRVRGAVVTLGGTVLEHCSREREGRTGGAALALVVDLARELIARAPRPVLGVGVATPGVVDPAGVVVKAPNLGWYDLALARDLRDALGVPVHAVNDANAAALGEHTFGGANGFGSLVVAIGQGVGAGLLLDGRLLLGEGFATGEIGHVTVVPDGAPCSCGRTGCLETALAAPRLRAQLQGLDDAPARDAVLAAAGRRLGEALAPVVAALNVQEVVLSGPDDLLDGALRAATLATLTERTMPVEGSALSVRMSLLADDVGLVGATAVVLSAELGVS